MSLTQPSLTAMDQTRELGRGHQPQNKPSSHSMNQSGESAAFLPTSELQDMPRLPPQNPCAGGQLEDPSAGRGPAGRPQCGAGAWGGQSRAWVAITHHGLKGPGSTQNRNQITLVSENAWPAPSPRSAMGSCTG